MNSIRQVFGNHNSYNMFMSLVKNVDNIYTPLPKPVMCRAINGPDSEIINSKLRHNKLMVFLSRELNTKYMEYNKE